MSANVQDMGSHSEKKIKPLNINQVPVRKIKVNENIHHQYAKNQSKFAKKKILNVPLIKQNPELKFGCEVTSLAMLLQYAGVKVDKLTLANKLEKDPDPMIKSKKGDIVRWGNPEDGFVGDMTGRHAGYAVFDKKLVELIEKYLPGHTVNLTGKSFDVLLMQVNRNRPVVVWTTGNYQAPDRWEQWQHKNETIKTPLDLHVVVLVGYDDQHVYVNDPLSGKKNHPVNKSTFIKSWEALKKRAISYN